MVQENRFGEFISNLRKEKGISLEQLSDGLCDTSLLSRFERGEREPEKLLQNRFLTRLGTVPENYENFLYYKEYCRWEKRQGIIHNILEENIETAKQLLEEYRQEYNMNYSLEQQFYLAMLAQIRRYEGCRNEDLADLFEKALQLTVPEIDTRSFQKRVLSLEEMNLLLEYWYCKRQEVSLQFYEMLLEYIEKMEQTMLAMAKIYPKTVYYYYSAWKKSEEPKETRVERMLEICDNAIELLRNANRMFYLWELFCMREELALMSSENISKGAHFYDRENDCREWKVNLEKIYQKYDVSIAMYESCYLYVESENYCIGDVIRIRRKMLGLSQEKLSEGICGSRTISRLERHICKPQKEIVQQLFERLNLSTEFCRTELVTDSQEAIEKYEEVRRQANNKNYKVVEKMIEEMKSLVSLDNSSNMQSIMRNEYINNYNQGKYSKEEYISKLKEVLQYTIPYESVLASNEKYLTNVEIGCIQSIVAKGDWTLEEMKECVSILTSFYDGLKFPAYYARMYEFVMLSVSSKLGDIGEYEQSNQIMENIIRMALKNRRIKAIDSLIYGILWNNQQMERDVTNKPMSVNGELTTCLAFCTLGNRIKNKEFYEKKIKEESAKNKTKCLSLAETY